MQPTVRAGVLGAVLVAGVAAASHGWGQYDNTQGMSLKGVIRSTAYDRPYQTIQLEVQKPEPRTWTVVLASPSKLESRGIPVKTLVPGLAVKVYVYPSRDVPDECRALRITVGGNTTELW